MADLFSAVELGEAVGPYDEPISLKCQAAVAKGQVVKLDTHTAQEMGSVSPAGAGDKAIGVALKTGAADEYVPVLLKGIVKVTCSGAITLGSPIKAAAAGKVQAAVNTVTVPSGATAVTSDSAQPSMTVEGGLAFGVALQTFANGDTGLVAVDCYRG